MGDHETTGTAGRAYFPLILFKSNAVAGQPGELWKKLFHHSQFDRSEFFARYRLRSIIEPKTSMIKRKSGDDLRSKCDVAMKNEVLTKFVCDNICRIIQELHASSVEFGARRAKIDLLSRQV